MRQKKKSPTDTCTVSAGIIIDNVQHQIRSGRTNGIVPVSPTRSVGMLVRAFKARCTRAINQLWQTSSVPVWQRNYYEHIIRDEEAYLKIAEYVQTNPQRWEDDTYYSSRSLRN